jgi:hypothetical protein
MENITIPFVVLSYVFTLIKKEELVYLLNLQKRIKEMDTQNFDPVLEFRLGLHKFSSLQILKLSQAGVISENEARLASEAVQSLFNEDGWWYKKFLEAFKDDSYRFALRELSRLLLYKTAVDTNDPTGVFYIPDKEREILSLSGGFSECKPMSDNEIGIKFDLTKERARQARCMTYERIHKKAKKIGVDTYFSYS